MKRIFVILMLLPMIWNISNSQITIYPSLVFIDPISRSGYIRVVNNSEGPMEIEIVASFSYKSADSANLIKTATDSLMESRHSLQKYLKIFPKRLVVQSKKDQMVRFLVMHPPDILDGTYVSNITLISQPLQKQIDTTDTKNIKMGVILKTGIISMVVYQKGKLTTSLAFGDLKTKLDTANLHLTFNFEKDGNSPYWGKAQISIFDTKGMEVDTLTEPFGVYCSTNKTFHLKKDKFRSGNYTAEITINTIRGDIPEERTIKVATITKRFEFTLP